MSSFFINVGASSLFFDNFTGIKWVLFFTLVPVFCFFRIYSSPTLIVPQFDRPARVGLVLLSVGLVVNLISIGPHIYLFPLVTGLVAVLLIFSISHVSLAEVGLIRASKISFFSATTAALVYLSLQKSGVEIFPQLYSGGMVGGSLFGNSGMAAEWLSISILFQGHELRTHRGNKYRLFLGVLMVISLTFLGTSGSRGAIIGLICAVGFLFWESPKLSAFKRQLALLVSVILGATVLLLLTRNNPNKAYSQIERVARWQNTIAMIGEHPLGLGPGSFMGEYLNYSRARKIDSEVNELILIDHPHNEYLRFASEYGAMTFFALLFLGFRLAKAASHSRKIGVIFLVSGLIFIGVDGFVNGVFCNPSMLFVSCLITGALLREVPKQRINSQILRRSLLGTVSILFFLGVGFSLAKWVESHPQQASPKVAEFLCDRYPSVWQNCLNLGMNKVSQGKFQEAQSVFKNVLNYNPNNFQTLKALAYVESEIGHKVESCRLLARYMEIFNYNSRYSDVYKANCK